MKHGIRIPRSSILILAFVLPLWLTIGRAYAGSIGWLVIFYLFTLTPVLFALLVVLFILAKSSPNSKGRKRLSSTMSWLTIWMSVSVILHGVFVVDVGDTSYGVSVASNLLGSGFNDISMIFAILFFCASLGLIIALYAIAIRERVAARPKNDYLA